MGKIIFSFLTVFALCLIAYSQSGVLNSSGGYSRYNIEQSSNAMSTPYTAKMADSVGAVVSTKYGVRYRLCRIANVSGTDQLLKVIAFNTNDTSLVFVPAGAATEKLFFIKKVISGAVIDSTRYDFVIE